MFSNDVEQLLMQILIKGEHLDIANKPGAIQTQDENLWLSVADYTPYI